MQALRIAALIFAASLSASYASPDAGGTVTTAQAPTFNASAASQTPSGQEAAAPAPLVAPASSQILDACMKVELPRVLEMLGTGLIRTREDAAINAHIHCQFVVSACLISPSSEDCQRPLITFGLGDPRYQLSPGAALFDAAYHGSIGAISRLLAEGAEPDWRNWFGWTPLMIAAAEKHLEAVELLLEAKADPNIRNQYGRTALMFAAKYGQSEIVEKLLAAGADPNIVSSDRVGRTALIAASVQGHARTVELLLHGGADPDIRARNGQTALELARSEGHFEVVEILTGASGTRK